MKTAKLTTWLLATLMLLALPVLAQDEPDAPVAPGDDDDIEMVWFGRHGGGPGGPGGGMAMFEELKLTKEQRKKMDDMRTAHHKDMIPIQAQVKVKRIELNELFESDASLSAINSKIDEIARLRTDVAKKQAAHRIAMRGLLTAEQKEIWDSRPHLGAPKAQRGKMMIERFRERRGGGDGPGWRGRGL